MSDFGSEIAARVARTIDSLQAAEAADDDYLSTVLLGELESLARVAGEHDVDIPGLRELLERHGHPVEVRLPDRSVIDLARQDGELAAQPARRIA